MNSMPPLYCITDSNQLYESVHSIKALKDKRLRIDIAVLHEMMKKEELTKVIWVAKTKQLADSLTKRGASTDLLLRVLASGTLRGVLFN